jgi:hypothetical protein
VTRVFLSAALLLTIGAAADTRIRVVNDGAVPAVVMLACDGARSALIDLAPHGVSDVDRNCSGALTLEAPPFVRALELTESTASEQQTLIGGGAACDFSRTIASPLTGCRFGIATVAVQPLAGATYVWSVEGGAILSGAAAVIPLLEPLAITSFTATGGQHGGELVTLTWTYVGYDPATQVLTGPDFPEPVRVPRTQRVFTFVPRASGTREIKLFAAITATTHLSGRRRSATASIHSWNCATATASVSITTD